MPEELLDGLDNVERWNVGAALALGASCGDPEGTAAWLARLSEVEQAALSGLVGSWMPVLCVDVDEGDLAVVVALGGVRVMARAAGGWVTDRELVERWDATGDVEAVAVLVGERLSDVGAWTDEVARC